MYDVYMYACRYAVYVCVKCMAARAPPPQSPRRRRRRGLYGVAILSLHFIIGSWQ